MQSEHQELRLTYAQLGARLGISAEAARTLTRRRGWRRIAPNRKGAPTIVALTADDLEGEQWRTEEDRSPPDNVAVSPEPEADSAGQRISEAERRADEANARADAALALADRIGAQLADAGERTDRAMSLLADAETVLKAERARADGLRDKLIGSQAELTLALAAAERARADAREAQKRTEALEQVEDARQARGRWARLRAAWRGQ
jgi:hypothetical protein